MLWYPGQLVENYPYYGEKSEPEKNLDRIRDNPDHSRILEIEEEENLEFFVLGWNSTFNELYCQAFNINWLPVLY